MIRLGAVSYLHMMSFGRVVGRKGVYKVWLNHTRWHLPSLADGAALQGMWEAWHE